MITTYLCLGMDQKPLKLLKILVIFQIEHFVVKKKMLRFIDSHGRGRIH